MPSHDGRPRAAVVVLGPGIRAATVVADIEFAHAVVPPRITAALRPAASGMP